MDAQEYDATLQEHMARLCDSPFLGDILRETVHAMTLHAPMNSMHEGYGVLLEEVDEFWEEVRKKRADRDHAHIRKELAQICAVAWRIVHDLCHEKENT